MTRCAVTSFARLKLEIDKVRRELYGSRSTAAGTAISTFDLIAGPPAKALNLTTTYSLAKIAAA